MCGIAGEVGPAADAAAVERMTDAQRHRGPDGRGRWSAPGVSVSHCRLKVLDVSEAGCQPMSTPEGRYTIVYNGEVYNYRELRAELPGVVWRTQTDTEVVLHAFAAWGPACLARFIGMYAFAVWDAKEQRLFCARDRLGIKPLYFAATKGQLAFASEIRALLAAGVTPEANASAVYDFLARDYYEHTDETFVAGVRKLPPGTWMWVERTGWPGPPQRYWDLAAASAQCEVSADPAAREEALIDRLSEAVRLHLRSDVPIGIALSGGLDSASLLALVDRVHPDPSRLAAYAFDFAQREYSERPYAEAMARHTGHAAFFEMIAPQEFVRDAQEFCDSQEEPTAGLPIYAYWRCFRRIRRQGCIVVMDGSGIDEALAGYERFRPAFWADLDAAHQRDRLEREWAASGVTSLEARRRAMAAMAEAASVSGDVGKGQDLTTSARPECLRKEFVAAASRPLPVFERPFPDHLRSLMFRELRYTKLPRALRFRDRLSMAVGCELRPPFLDHRLLAYAFALPPEDRIQDGTSKAILRRASKRLLPDAVRLAPKRTVQTPQREWMRCELQDWVRAVVDAPQFWNRGWVEPRAGRAAMEAFFRGEGDNSFFLWQWINLELWARQFLDQPVMAPA